MNTKETKNDVQKEVPPLDEPLLIDDRIVADFENELKEAKRKNTELKFLFFLCMIILLDVIFFILIQNWAGAIGITILEIILIIYAGGISGVKDIGILLDKILHTFAKRDPRE